MNRNFWKRHESVQAADERRLRLHYLAQQLLRKRREQQAAGGDEQSLPAVLNCPTEMDAQRQARLLTAITWTDLEGEYAHAMASGCDNRGGTDVILALYGTKEGKDLTMQMGTVMYAGHYYEVIDYREVSDTFLLFPIEAGDRKLWAPRDEIQIVIFEKLWNGFLNDASVDQVMKGEVVILKSVAAASATGK